MDNMGQSSEKQIDDSSLLTRNSGSQAGGYHQRSCLQRAFGPMKKGSFRSVLFALLASAMGTGIFNLSLRIEEVGIVLFLVFVGMAAIFSSLGMYFISRLIIREGAETYSQMAFQGFGTPMRRVSEFIVFIYPFGVNVCFQVILAKFIIELLYDVAGIALYDNRQKEVYNSAGEHLFYLGNICRILLNIGLILLSMPFILKKKIGILQNLSMISVIAVVFNAFTIIITSISGFEQTVIIQGEEVVECYKGIFGVEDWSRLEWIKLNNLEELSIAAQSFASTIFCFINHQLLFPLIAQLRQPTERRVNSLMRRAHLTQTLVYLLVGISGYLLLSQHQDKVPIDVMVIASIRTIPITIGKVAMVVGIFFTIPMNFFAARQVLFDALGLEMTIRNHLLTSIGVALSSCTIAIVFKDINSYFGFMGGTAAVIMAGIIPCATFAKSNKHPNFLHFAAYSFVIISSLLGFTGALLSIIDRN